MKRLILSILVIFSVGMAQAQLRISNPAIEKPGHFKIGVNLGAPVGDASDFTNIAWGVEAGYLWHLTPEFNAGITAGYLHYVTKDFDGWSLPNIGFIPVAATAQYSLMENLFVGADLGYGIGVTPSGNDGGFYYQPKLGYQIDLFEVYAGYKGLSRSGGSVNTVAVGFNYKF